MGDNISTDDIRYDVSEKTQDFFAFFMENSITQTLGSIYNNINLYF